MSQLPRKSWLASMSPITRTLLGLGVILLVVVLGVLYGPHYDDTNTTTGDTLPTTPTVVGPNGSLSINRSIVHQGIAVTVVSVQQAQSFSNDGKSAYAHVKYVVRVLLAIKAPADQQGAKGVDFCALSHLVVADGTQLPCRLAQLSPDVLPGQQEEGFIDFWVNAPLTLPSLSFVLGDASVAFK